MTIERERVLEEALRKAQNALAEYIVPNSGISDRECVNNLLGILDSQTLIRALSSPLRPEGEADRIRPALYAAPLAQPLAPARKTFTLNLTDVEMAALEELARKQDLSPQRVMIQGLRRYQLFVNGEPNLGPMLPPELAQPVATAGERERIAELEKACQAAWRSISRFPGSVHDRAMAKLEKALKGRQIDYIDPDEAIINKLYAELAALRPPLTQPKAEEAGK